MLNSKTHLATIGILIKDRVTQAPNINSILTKNSNLILARTGLNLQPKCIEGCTAVITLICQGSSKELNLFNEKINNLYGIVAKINFLTK
ncbi:MAG TPA: hypothetical protein GX706_00575 [Candidatus Moranbacteria bacterium]|nr:hypothetical protein [Candidatus Moranbacteria bacterium]